MDETMTKILDKDGAFSMQHGWREFEKLAKQFKGKLHCRWVWSIEGEIICESHSSVETTIRLARALNAFEDGFDSKMYVYCDEFKKAFAQQEFEQKQLEIWG